MSLIGPAGRSTAVLLDVDGTLVDSNFHHVVAWQRALSECGHAVPTHFLLGIVGMGSDRFVRAAAGEQAEREVGDRARELHAEYYGRFADWIDPLPGAEELVHALLERGCAVVVTSSGEQDDVDRHLRSLGIAADDLAGVVTGADVKATKPSPDLFQVALQKAGARPSEAIAVGDTIWDVRGATQAGVATVGLATGGTSAAELRDVGAAAVYEDAAALTRSLDEALARAIAPGMAVG